MEGYSRSRALRYKPKHEPLKTGDLKIQSSFKDGHTSVLAVLASSVTEEFVKRFCNEHNLTYRVQGAYYYLT